MDSVFAPIWGSLIIFVVCPLLGGLPLVAWLTRLFSGKKLNEIGTGNISVSAAFYHGGKLAGILAVISEAAKGIIAVLLTRLFFPDGSVWELLALIGLIMGRYWLSKGAGTTNVVWGIFAHDLKVFGITILLGMISFTINRDRKLGKIGILVILTVVIGLFNPGNPEYFVTAAVLSGLMWWIYRQIPDDLDLSANQVHSSSSNVFRFFQTEKNIVSLDQKLASDRVGAKASNLSLVKSLGHNVPTGWVIAPGEDSQALINSLRPSTEQPLVVRSSALEEDGKSASFAGQYLSILNVASKEALQTAILDCQASYAARSAQKYRTQNKQGAGGMAVLVQEQISGTFSGVAFSRDPLNSGNGKVVIETLPGYATKVVSGKFNPQRYQVTIPDGFIPDVASAEESGSQAPESENLERENLKIKNGQSLVISPKPLTDSISPDRHILESVALLAREMEAIFQGIPQDIEWTYDGEKLWLLQVRPITTLTTIWTRKIAAEVIPGQIHPLTWSINQPLTCRSWGDLFTLVLGSKVHDVDFSQTAALHYGRAYFNASLLGDLFIRMGLPAESLEFLTRGKKIKRPPILSTLKNLPGLWKLRQQEAILIRDFAQDYQQSFDPLLKELRAEPGANLSSSELLMRIETILMTLEKATYFSILAPLGFAIRQKVMRVELNDLSNNQAPEIVSMQSLANIAADARRLIGKEQITMNSCASLFAYLAENSEGESILLRFNSWLAEYGYLGDVTTDISVTRWGDDPRPVKNIFARFFFDYTACQQAQNQVKSSEPGWLDKQVQARLDLKGEVSKVYSQLLAYLRWDFLALEAIFLQTDWLLAPGDIFFLELAEIKDLVKEFDPTKFKKIVNRRKQQWQREQDLKIVPYLVYGEPGSLPLGEDFTDLASQQLSTQKLLQGIGTSQGQIEGEIRVITDLNQLNQDHSEQEINNQTILVVPYTDAAWSSLLALVGGLVSEVGGILSHGAIVAREYGIPAIMDIPYATQRLEDGMRVRIDGKTGIVEILD